MNLLDSLKTTAFTISDGVEVSWLQILSSITFVIVAWYVSRLLAYLLVRKILSKTKISPDSKAIIQRVIFFSMIILVVLSVLTYLGIPLATFAFISGAVAIGFGFGAKTIIENFLSGWILMSERPIRIGDIIELDGLLGVVIMIGNRSTQIRRNDGAHIIVPNSQVLESRLVNWTLIDPYIRTSVRVGVAYGSDVTKVKQLLLEAVESHELVQKEPESIIVFEDFADSALVFDAFFWVSVQTGKELRIVRSEIRFLVEKIFRENDVVISFPQRDVHLNFADPSQLKHLKGADHE
ncbi:MAG: mechanosensitive ion channel [Xanthomonadales bacterium]|nr:mechanosensitive ion channel [Xanthomonadales bacterium]